MLKPFFSFLFHNSRLPPLPKVEEARRILFKCRTVGKGAEERFPGSQLTLVIILALA